MLDRRSQPQGRGESGDLPALFKPAVVAKISCWRVKAAQSIDNGKTGDSQL